MTISIKSCLLFLVFLWTSGVAIASHIVGADFAYTYNGDTMIGSIQHNIYTVSLSIYQDCQSGKPAAIAEDNPAFLAAYTTGGRRIRVDTIFYASSIMVPPVINASPCATTVIPVCLIKKIFTKRYYLKPSDSGYVIAYQRCCRNNGIVNIVAPGDNGQTFMCSIPPAPIVNNSAVFNHNPHQMLCHGMPLYYDNSAYDPDGDSLSYGFVSALNGADGASIKPLPLPPPYQPVSYIGSYSAQLPFSNSTTISIDPLTGIMSGTPDKQGRFLVTVCCYEWRNGVLIDSVTREFQFIVAPCDSKDFTPDAGADTTVMVGDSVYFHASGGRFYNWTPSTFLNDPTKGDAAGKFTTPGLFTYTLHAVTDSGCGGVDSRNVWVIEYARFVLPNAFSPNGDGLNERLKPLAVQNATLVGFKVVNRQGKIVYDGGPNDAGWDGTYNGTKQDMNSYLWQITYLDNNAVERKQAGNVTLVK